MQRLAHRRHRVPRDGCSRATSSAPTGASTRSCAARTTARPRARAADAAAPVRRRPSLRRRVVAVRGDLTRRGPGPGRAARRGWPERSARSCTAPRRCRSSSGWTRRARSTSRARGGCSSSPSAASARRGCGASPTSRPRTSPATTRGASARTTSTSGSASATPTSSSKFEAERSWPAGAGGCRSRSLRPSIVVGERDSGWTTSFNVLYWPLRAFARGDLPRACPRARDAPVDVVPVDYVADAIFALTQTPEAAGRDVPPHRRARTSAASGELVELASALLRAPGAAADRSCALSPRGAPAAAPRQPRRAASAGRCDAARCSSRTSPPASRYDDRRARAALHGTRDRAPPLREYFDRLVAVRARRRLGPAADRRAPAWYACRARGARRRAPAAPQIRDQLVLRGMSRARLSGLDASFLAVETPTGAHARGLGGDLRRARRRRAAAELRTSCASTSSGGSRARRATARSSRRSRSGCTRRSGSTTRRSRSSATSTGRPARSHDLVDEVMSIAAAPRPPAVGDVDLRGPERQAVRGRRQGPPLHGRRDRGGRARLAPARPDAGGPRRASRRLARGASPAPSGCS